MSTSYFREFARFVPCVTTSEPRRVEPCIERTPEEGQKRCAMCGGIVRKTSAHRLLPTRQNRSACPQGRIPPAAHSNFRVGIVHSQRENIGETPPLRIFSLCRTSLSVKSSPPHLHPSLFSERIPPTASERRLLTIRHRHAMILRRAPRIRRCGSFPLLSAPRNLSLRPFGVRLRLADGMSFAFSIEREQGNAQQEGTKEEICMPPLPSHECVVRHTLYSQ